MSMTGNNSAFPVFREVQRDDAGEPKNTGLTAREYAAIKLRLPDSGTDWLDVMIRKANRDQFIERGMIALILGTDIEGAYEIKQPDHALAMKFCTDVFDTILETREK